MKVQLSLGDNNSPRDVNKRFLHVDHKIPTFPLVQIVKKHGLEGVQRLTVVSDHGNHGLVFHVVELRGSVQLLKKGYHFIA